MKNKIVDSLQTAWLTLKKDHGFSEDVQFSLADIVDTQDRKFGDVSSNAALKLAKRLGCPPIKLAQLFAQQLQHSNNPFFDKVEAYPPGFINFFLKSDTHYMVLKNILHQKQQYGCCVASGVPEKVLMEYVSANPTGPLTLAHARQAVVGDVIANILEACGHSVVREYYLNDRGLQIENLGRSIFYRYLECMGISVTFPEDLYQGDYIGDMARDIYNEYNDKLGKEWNAATQDFFSGYGKDHIMQEFYRSLELARVRFDHYFSEKEMTKTSMIQDVLKELEKRGVVYEKDGARWLRSTQYGDDKDRVLVRSNGEMTYIAPDIAYHKNKLERGFTRVINIWGPDHHGYIPRIKAAMQALGYGADKIHVIILQLCTLYEGEIKKSMSTRKAEYVTLDEVFQEVGVDAARFFFCMRNTDSHLDFDLKLAKEESPNNPVYYVQYAHARICNIHENAKEAGFGINDNGDGVMWSRLQEPSELELIKKMNQFPECVLKASEVLEPSRITEYLKELAGDFHTYYNKSRVISADPELSLARLHLVECVRIVLANGLKLLGVTAPKRM